MRPGSGGSTAAHYTAHFMRQQSHLAAAHLAAQQNMRRRWVFQLAQAVVDTPATIEDYQKLAEIVQDAREQNLEPEQIEAKILKSTPFTGLTQYLKENHLTILSIVLTIILYILSQQQPTKVEIVKPSIEDIIKQLEKHIDENRPAQPTPTDRPDHEQHEKPRSCQ
jgi:predicted DNA-binding transcriptional regulator